MDEREFRRLLDLFPVVRSRSYCANSEPARGSTSQTKKDETKEWQDAWSEMDTKNESEGGGIEDQFWQKLRLAAEEKVGQAKAEQFCKAFQRVYSELVNKGLSLAAARSFIDGEVDGLD